MDFQEAFLEAGKTAEFMAHSALLDFIHDVVEELDRKGWGQSDLARAAHLQDAQISRILSGSQNITFSTMGKIASALGLRPMVSLKRPAIAAENMPARKVAAPIVRADAFAYSASPDKAGDSNEAKRMPRKRRQWAV